MSDATKSLKLPAQLVPFKRPCRFLNLPAEIRNKIYVMVLCNIQDPQIPGNSDMPDDFAMNKQDIHIPLLQTCRQIHDEAKSAMLKTNLFVEVRFITGLGRIPCYGVLEVLQLWRVPLFRINQNIKVRDKGPASRKPNGCVMRHQISPVGEYIIGENSMADSMIILHRHMDLFFEAINQTQWFKLYMNEGTRHEVTLLNPFVPEPALGNEIAVRGSHAIASPLSTEFLLNLREKLLSPLCNSLKLPYKFTIKGRSTKDPQTLFEVEVTGATMTVENSVKELSELMEVGNKYFVQKSFGYAEAFYQLVNFRIALLLNRKNVATRGFLEFIGEDPNNLVDSFFVDLCLCRARNAVSAMKAISHSKPEELEDLYDTVHKMALDVSTKVQFTSPERKSQVRWSFMSFEVVAFRLLHQAQHRS